MSATNPESSGARKRTLSTKAATNGDPNAERKRQRLEEEQKKGTKKPLTKKKPTTTASKKKATTKKAAKTAPQRPSVDIEEVSKPTSNIGASDDDSADDPDEDSDEDTVEVLEAPEESAEAQLRMFHLFS
jgi:hypothetical protein